tara:strand:- start:633 stop:773 length:141 start_codon:yes stop_codon:yes gene_type:complete
MQAIHLGRLQDRVTMSGDVTVTLVIGDDDYDVGALRNEIEGQKGTA